MATNKRRVVLLALLALGIITAWVYWPHPTAPVPRLSEAHSIRIVDEHGQAVPRATVSIFITGANSSVGRTLSLVTNRDGMFRIPKIDEGETWGVAYVHAATGLSGMFRVSALEREWTVRVDGIRRALFYEPISGDIYR